MSEWSSREWKKETVSTLIFTVQRVTERQTKPSKLRTYITDAHRTIILSRSYLHINIVRFPPSNTTATATAGTMATTCALSTHAAHMRSSSLLLPRHVITVSDCLNKRKTYSCLIFVTFWCVFFLFSFLLLSIFLCFLISHALKCRIRGKIERNARAHA